MTIIKFYLPVRSKRKWLTTILGYKMHKTPDKVQEKIPKTSEKTPEKLPAEENEDDIKNNAVPPKEISSKTEFETPEKTGHGDSVSHSAENNKTPEKNYAKDVMDLNLESVSCDGEGGMITAAEQARLLLAANKTPSKCINKTPVKQNTPSGKRSIEHSPVTPGKYKKVDLITLASPKAKKIKQI